MSEGETASRGSETYKAGWSYIQPESYYQSEPRRANLCSISISGVSEPTLCTVAAAAGTQEGRPGVMDTREGREGVDGKGVRVMDKRRG